MHSDTDGIKRIPIIEDGQNVVVAAGYNTSSLRFDMRAVEVVEQPVVGKFLRLKRSKN